MKKLIVIFFVFITLLLPNVTQARFDDQILSNRGAELLYADFAQLAQRYGIPKSNISKLSLSNIKESCRFFYKYSNDNASAEIMYMLTPSGYVDGISIDGSDMTINTQRAWQLAIGLCLKTLNLTDDEIEYLVQHQKLNNSQAFFRVGSEPHNLYTSRVWANNIKQNIDLFVTHYQSGRVLVFIVSMSH